MKTMKTKPPTTVNAPTTGLLTPTITFKPAGGQQREAAALNNLVGFLNNPEITGNRPPAPFPGKPADGPPPAPANTKEPMPSKVEPSGMVNPRVALGPQTKIFFTGRMRAGKDHVAKAAEAQIFGFADPIYWLMVRLFGVAATKTSPGGREWLQTIGQWGRAVYSTAYPLTPTRAIFANMIRVMAPTLTKERPDLGVDWENFGRSTGLWLEAALRRVEAWQITNGNTARIAITNARFDNEVQVLKTCGWNHWHIMCSPKTLAVRLAKDGQAANGKAQNDLSEQVARKFDESVYRLIKTAQRGAMLRVIWNDDAVSPSPRLYTVNQWLQELAVLEVAE